MSLWTFQWSKHNSLTENSQQSYVWLLLTIDEFWVLSHRGSKWPMSVTLGSCSHWTTTCAYAGHVSIIVLLDFIAPCFRCHDERTTVSLVFVTLNIHRSFSFTKLLLDSLKAVFARLFEQSWTYHRREEYVEDCITPALTSITNSLRDKNTICSELLV